MSALEPGSAAKAAKDRKRAVLRVERAVYFPTPCCRDSRSLKTQQWGSGNFLACATTTAVTAPD